MERLPDEISLHILSFLEAVDILNLTLVSRRYLKITRDHELWRFLCTRDSRFPSRSSRHRDGRYGGPMPIPEPSVFALQRAVSRVTATSKGDDETNESQPSTRARSPVLLTTSEESHNVNWYNEYVARYAPLSIGWLPTSTEEAGSPSDVDGIGLFKRDGRQHLVAPLNDGSVCLWDVGDAMPTSEVDAGGIASRSKPGLCGESQAFDRGEGSQVSTDQSRLKAYISNGPVLVEVDLVTFQTTQFYQAPDTGLGGSTDTISALSEGGCSPHPLTIGTTRALHLYDYRMSNLQNATSAAKLDQDMGGGRRYEMCGFSYQWVGLDPLPLSILHLPDGIQVGGRFPSILNYDRRNFPRLASAIYSGARISSLVALPSSASPGAIAAAGDYKGKGSLEIYPFGDSSDAANSTESIRNRTSASRSKLLSLAPHGNRLMFSDSDGQIKWVERDATTLVRRWNINEWNLSHRSNARRGIFNVASEEGHVARKLLPLGNSERSEVAVWTGEKVGVLGFGPRPRIGLRREEDRSASEAESEGDERPNDQNQRRFERMMRRALERQADEVRFVPALGLDRAR